MENLHKRPYTGSNNRKWTLGRMKNMLKIQSISIFDKKTGEFLGYKYIQHIFN